MSVGGKTFSTTETGGAVSREGIDDGRVPHKYQYEVLSSKMLWRIDNGVRSGTS